MSAEPDVDGRPGPTPLQLRVQLFFSSHVTNPKLHTRVYRATGGRLGSRIPGVGPRVALLTTVGRTTGEDRTTPVVHFDIAGRAVVAATNSGTDRDPGWWRNLQKTPTAVLQRGRRVESVTARQATGDERARLWTEIVRLHPLFGEYQRRTARAIPVVVLDALA